MENGLWLALFLIGTLAIGFAGLWAFDYINFCRHDWRPIDSLYAECSKCRKIGWLDTSGY